MTKIDTSFDKNFDSFEAETFEPEPTFENIINEIKDNHLKIIASDAINISDITYFDQKFDPISMNNRSKAAKSEPEPTFENTINNIKANQLKSITYIDMNVSAINSNKPSSSFENPQYDLMPWIILQSPEKSPQFTHHLSSM